MPIVVGEEPLKNQRIAILDGFRALAILPVILFHFFSSWTPPLNPVDLYPYGSAYSGIPLFRYGYLGVQFFFVISGFVISMTLASSKAPWQFVAKRIARLWPAMVLCSSLTLITVKYVPHSPFAAHARDFVPSLLFMDPYLLGKVLKNEFAWMDPSYWSLFVEVRFYFWVALTFFLARTRFLELFFALSTAATLLSVAAEAQFPTFALVVRILFFTTYVPWFTIGIGFFCLYVNKRAGAFVHFAIVESLGVLALQVCFTRNLSAPPNSSIGMQLAVLVGIVGAFYTFIYKPRWLSIFGWWPITTLGAASYSLYLLHQYIGLTLLRYLTDLLGAPGELVAIVVILLLMGLSIVVYRCWETPSRNVMLRLLLPARSATSPLVARPQVEPV